MEGGKLENPEKNPRSKDENQQQTQPTYDTWPESNPGHIGGRRALSPLRHPCSPKAMLTRRPRRLRETKRAMGTRMSREQGEAEQWRLYSERA